MEGRGRGRRRGRERGGVGWREGGGGGVKEISCFGLYIQRTMEP